jgi:Flp pilus assembly protein TadG
MMEDTLRTSSRSRRKILRLFRGRKGEEGATLVEMALVTAFVYLPMLFFIFEISYAIYAYNFVSLMSREASRYASVRGAYSCIVLSTFPNCNLRPATASNLQSWVQSQTFTGLNAGNITVNTSWWSATVGPGSGAYSTTTWNNQCTTTDTNGNACNTAGNAVQVTVTYAFPLNIPFWQQRTLSLSSTSRMVINI